MRAVEKPRLEILVTPFYLDMMNRNAPGQGERLFTRLLAVGKSTTVNEVAALLRDPWRATVMGAWFSLMHEDRRITGEVLRALTESQGALTSPPLATASVVLADPDAARDALLDYLRRDQANQWGAAGFVAAALEHLGATSLPLTPSQEDRRDLFSMLLLAHRLRDGGKAGVMPSSLASLTPRQLLAQYSEILSELIHRGVIRSRNAPAGDYAEVLVARLYMGELARPSVKSYDVTSADGSRIQVKCRVLPAATRRGTFSPFRSFDFDACIFIVLDAQDYMVTRAVKMDAKTIEGLSREVAWVAGRRVSVSQILASQQGEDVTAELRTTQDLLDQRPGVDSLVDR